MRRKKMRTLMGVLGIIVSVALLTGVNATIDSYSYTYVDQAEQSEGIIDFMITRDADDETNPTYNDYIFKEAEVRSYVDYIEGVKDVSPRLRALVEVEVDKPGEENDKEVNLELMGMDVAREDELGIGNFRLIEGTYDLEGKKVFIQQSTANLLGVEVGDEIKIKALEWNTDSGGSKTQEFEVTGIIENENRLSSDDENVLIAGLWTVRDLTRSSKYVTELIGVFEEREFLYDVTDVDETLESTVEIGTRIQEAIGYDYDVTLPITEAMQQLEQSGMFTRVMLWLVAIIAMIIVCVLMYSLLTISVEEKTHDFGLFIAIGAKKTQVFRLVLLEAVIISVIGTVVGVILGYFVSVGLLSYLMGGGGISIIGTGPVGGARRGATTSALLFDIVILVQTLALSSTAGILVDFNQIISGVVYPIISGVIFLNRGSHKSTQIVNTYDPDVDGHADDIIPMFDRTIVTEELNDKKPMQSISEVS